MAQSNSFSVTVQASGGGGGAPAYIASMSPFQVRAMSGDYAPTNGTSTLTAVMPSIWNGNTDIIRPWSGGAKPNTGTKMFVHGGGHADSSNNGLYSFDFAGDSRPTGWAVENAGQTGVSTDIAVGANGAPISVHTYDGMVDMGPSLYRFGGSAYPSGGFTSQFVRYTKASSTWTRIPSAGYNNFAGTALANPSAGKVLVIERYATYVTYAFYREATNDWSPIRSVGSQWPNSPSSSYDPVGNVGLVISGGLAFSIAINWTSETITQTTRSLPNVGSGPAVIWSAATSRFWLFGGTGNYSSIHAVNPADWSMTTHALSGASLTPEATYNGTFGRYVLMDSWRAIGIVMSRNVAAAVIRLPTSV